MNDLTLLGTKVRVDKEGMICLTDMWKASGKSESESPYHYLRNKQTKEFLSELEKNHESVVFTVRGVNGGTYGGKFVAYDYAAWLNPSFKYAAYKVLDSYFSGQLISVASFMAEANMAGYIFNQEASIVSDCARTMNYWGRGGRKAHLLHNKQEAENKLQIALNYK